MTTQETLDVHLKIIKDLMTKVDQVDAEYLSKFFLIGVDVGRACAQKEHLEKEIELLKLQTIEKIEIKNEN